MHTPFSDHSSSMNEYNAVKVQLDKILTKKSKGLFYVAKVDGMKTEQKTPTTFSSRKTKFPKEKNFKAKTI